MRWPLALLMTLAGCGDNAPKPPAPDQPAGKVISIEGSARAARPRSDSRPLEVGTIIYGEDTVFTPAKSSVTLRLAHNGAKLTLRGADQRRVDQSSAWTASGKVVEGLLDKRETDRTSAAGQHTEKLAGELLDEAPHQDNASKDEKDKGDKKEQLKPKQPDFDAKLVRRLITKIIKDCDADSSAAGTVVTTLTIGTDGRVANIEVSVDNDKLEPIATCAEEIFETERVSAPPQPVTLVVRVTFRGK